MKKSKLFLLVLPIAMLLSCDERLSGENLDIGDKMYASGLSVYTRVHETNSKGFIDGHAQVDSNKIVQLYTEPNFDRRFFFDRENTFVGTYQGLCPFDSDYAILELDDDIKKIVQNHRELSEKIKVSKKDFYSGKVRKDVVLENFPDEIYVKLAALDTVSLDSIFDVLR